MIARALEHVLYADQRVGRRGTPLTVPKLRTMLHEAAMLEDLVRLDASVDAYGKLVPDPRILMLGGVLRRFWVDESPQIALVLSGELNLVGLRARTPHGLRRLPADLQEAYLELGPSLIGVAYCVDPAGDMNEARRRFVEAYRRDRADTRIRYLSGFAGNVVRGRLSS